MVDWHVVQVERFVLELVVVLQRVRLDQSPCEIKLGTKVTVDAEQDVLFVKNGVEIIGFCFVTQQDFSA